MKKKTQNPGLVPVEHLKVELENGMTILTIVTSNQDLNKIVDGTTKQVSQYVKPASEHKLVEHDEEDFIMTDDYGNSQPIHYDAIRFYDGYMKNRSSVLVKVLAAKSEVFTDENGHPIEYVVDDNAQPIRDEKGDFIEPEYDEEGNCINGRLYWLEQVVYDLGEIIG